MIDFFSQRIAMALAVIAIAFMLPALAMAQTQPGTIKVNCDVAKDEIKIEPFKGDSVGGKVIWNFDQSIENCKTTTKERTLKEAGLDTVEIIVLKTDRSLPFPLTQLLREARAKWEPGKGATIQAQVGIADAGDILVNYKISFNDKSDKELREARAEVVLHTGILAMTGWGLIVLAMLLASSLAWMIRKRVQPRLAGM